MRVVYMKQTIEMMDEESLRSLKGFVIKTTSQGVQYIIEE